jgi:type IV secretion system protein VirB10
MTAVPPQPEAEEVRAEPVVDRGVSPIQGRLAGRPGRLVALAALLLGGGVFLAATWDGGEPRRAEPRESDTPPRQLTPFEPARRDPPRLADAATDPEAPRLTDEPIPALESATGAASPEASARAESRRTLADSARRAPLLAYSRTGEAVGAPRSTTASPEPAGEPNPLDALRRASPVGQAPAGRLTDRNLLITAGTSVPCILQTALDSTTPGYVTCVLPRDVYSENGAVVLLERGTRVLGEYRGGLQQGRRRLFVLWTRAVTPTGVAVALASPASDALGRAGFDGSVDTRFWDRFGGALLLSLVDDGAWAAFGDGDARGGARLPSDAAAAALEGSIDIPPTLRKAQGSEVTIFVAQDLDFRGVYRLKSR